MTVKRSRFSRSSYNLLADAKLANSRRCGDERPRVKTVRRCAAAEEPKPQIEERRTAETEKVEEESLVVSKFLEKCFGCGKRIGAADEVFMYSYLRAFCSADCREVQIEKDKRFGDVSGDGDKLRSG